MTANISAATMQVTGVSAADKTYDATRTANLTGTATVNPLRSDAVGVDSAGAAGLFNTKNVGAAKSVAVTGYGLTGADAGNYAIAQPTGVTASISAATLQVTGVSAADKTYDATRAATLTGTAAVTPLGSDAVAVSSTGASGLFNAKNVGSVKAVTVAGFSLSGDDAGNYVLVQPTGLTAAITPATLQITGIGAMGKTYDAGSVAALTGTATVAPLGADVVGVVGSGTGQFADKNAGSSKPVAVTGFSLTGSDASNYAVAQPVGLTATIDPALLRYAATPLRLMNGQSIVGLTGEVTGLVGADTLATATSGSLLWSTNATPGSAPGLYAVTGSGLSASNYRWTQAAGNATALTLQPSALPGNVTAVTTQLANSVVAPQANNTATLPSIGSRAEASGGSSSGSSGNPDTPPAAPKSSGEAGNSNSNSNSGGSGTSTGGAPSVGQLAIGGGSGRVQVIGGGIRLPSNGTAAP